MVELAEQWQKYSLAEARLSAAYTDLVGFLSAGINEEELSHDTAAVAVSVWRMANIKTSTTPPAGYAATQSEAQNFLAVLGSLDKLSTYTTAGVTYPNRASPVGFAVQQPTGSHKKNYLLTYRR